MDVDGVLNPRTAWNPVEQEQKVILSEQRRKLLAEAAALGTLVWATSCSIAVTGQLERQSSITEATLRIPLAGAGSRAAPAATPKLKPVSRWVTRFIAESSDQEAVIVWVDDVHGRDAHTWAATCGFPVLLLTTDPRNGITNESLQKIRSWVSAGRQV